MPAGAVEAMGGLDAELDPQALLLSKGQVGAAPWHACFCGHSWPSLGAWKAVASASLCAVTTNKVPKVHATDCLHFRKLQNNGLQHTHISHFPFLPVQLQLLCLARAVVRDASILILDEANASVDAASDAIMEVRMGALWS